jgi:hypothetical protein
MKFSINEEVFNLKNGLIHFKGSKLKNEVYSKIFYAINNKKYFVGGLAHKFCKKNIENNWIYDILDKNLLFSMDINTTHIYNEDKYELSYNFIKEIEYDKIPKKIERNKRCSILSDKTPQIFSIFTSNIPPIKCTWDILDGLNMLKTHKGCDLNNYKNNNFYNLFFDKDDISIDILDTTINVNDFINLNNYPINNIFSAMGLFELNSLDKNVKYIVLSNIETYLNNKQLYTFLEVLNTFIVRTGIKVLLFTSMELSTRKISKIFNGAYSYYNI